MKAIFSDEPPRLPRPSRMPLWCKDSHAQPPAQAAKDVRSSTKVPLPGRAIFAAAIKVSKNVSFKARRSEILEVSLGKLIACLRLVSINFVPLPLVHQGRIDQESVAAAVGNRSPWTVSKRAGSFNLYLRWYLNQTSLDSESLEEISVWLYMVSS